MSKTEVKLFKKFLGSTERKRIIVHLAMKGGVKNWADIERKNSRLTHQGKLMEEAGLVITNKEGLKDFNYKKYPMLHDLKKDIKPLADKLGVVKDVQKCSRYKKTRTDPAMFSFSDSFLNELLGHIIDVHKKVKKVKK